MTIGIAALSYAESTFGNVLRAGLVYHSAHSAIFDGNIGQPVYIGSDSVASIQVDLATSTFIIGFVEPEQSNPIEVDTNVWRFMPELVWGSNVIV